MTTRSLLLALAAFAVGCSSSVSDDDDAANDDDAVDAFSCDGITPEVTEISPDELDAMLADKDFEFVNVHIPRQGEIPDTDAHIAYTDVDGLEAHLAEDVGAKVVLYCRTGPMSAIAASSLVDLGYCRVFDLPVGMVGWEAEGYPLGD